MPNKPSERPQSGQHRTLIAAILALATSASACDRSRAEYQEPDLDTLVEALAASASTEPTKDFVTLEIGGQSVILRKEMVEKLQAADAEILAETGKGLELSPVMGVDGKPLLQHGPAEPEGESIHQWEWEKAEAEAE